MHTEYTERTRTYCVARLDDGSLVTYAAAGSTPDTYDPAKFYCVGAGVIHSIDGVIQTGTMRRYFFVRK